MKESMIAAMKSRHSVRSYSNKKISHATAGILSDFLKHIENPFGTHLRLELISMKEYPGNQRLSTYGVIKNPQNFIAGITDREVFALEALGYVFEAGILKCTDLGLATCWLGGTFNKGGFADTVGLKANEVLPIISPVGYGTGRKTVVSKMMGKSGKRLPHEEIFYKNEWRDPVLPKTAGIFSVPLEMVRIAPSSRNSQPWRALIEDEKAVHFYQTSSKQMNRVDMGIALCHFDLSCKELGISGHFAQEKPTVQGMENAHYTMSWLVDE